MRLRVRVSVRLSVRASGRYVNPDAQTNMNLNVVYMYDVVYVYIILSMVYTAYVSCTRLPSRAYCCRTGCPKFLLGRYGSFRWLHAPA